MTTESNIVEMTLESDLNRVEVVEEVARRVSATAGFDEDDQHKIEMAVHESVINAIWHGNKNDPAKQVWLRFQIFDDRLEIRVRDQGGGFDPGKVANPLAEENLLSVSGRGIFLIRTFMDEYRVKIVEGQGTEVTLVKRLDSNNSGQSRRDGP
ncbi:MAG: ATP-binding protein [Acidobacteria bacterium]|nr:ATP-binding protein [Acidobacteriota bacterium]